MILRWARTLSGRLTLFIFAALIAAQLVGILIFVDSNERERDELTSENFLRQVAALTLLYNSTPELNRENYLRTVRQPGLKFWLADTPSVPDAPLSAAAPKPPSSWNSIASPDKRLIWYADNRPLTVKFRIAPPPLERNLRRRNDGLEGPPPPELAPSEVIGPPGDETFSMEPMRIRARADYEESLNDPDRRPERGPPPGRDGRGPGPNEGRPDGPPDRPPPPEMRGEMRAEGPPLPQPGSPAAPRVRWRTAVLLDNGEWLNAEHMYQIGLPPWLETVLFQSGVTLAIMLAFVVPVITLATKRLTQLARAADKVGRGEDTEPLPESGAFEIRQLTQAFNNMSLRLRRFVQGRTQMLAGISHDLRTPITALRLRADLVDDDENRERMIHLIDDMHQLTEATLTLARDDSFTEKTDRVDLSALIEGICDDLMDAGIDVTCDVGRGVNLTCRPHSLRRAIRNLAENGAKYGHRSRIALSERDKYIDIIIDDDGPGIPEDQMEQAFLPFVRLEGSRSRETGGSGLGLAITRSIILNHGGDISLVNRPEGGLRATIMLPKPDEI